MHEGEKVDTMRRGKTTSSCILRSMLPEGWEDSKRRVQLSQKSTLLRRHRSRCSRPRLFPTKNVECDKTAFGKERRITEANRVIYVYDTDTSG